MQLVLNYNGWPNAPRSLPMLLDLLLAPLPPGVGESANIPCPHLTIEQPRTLIEKSGISSPVTITEEVLRTDEQLIIAAAREP